MLFEQFAKNLGQAHKTKTYMDATLKIIQTSLFFTYGGPNDEKNYVNQQLGWNSQYLFAAVVTTNCSILGSTGVLQFS
jgi:hypothetical protein